MDSPATYSCGGAGGSSFGAAALNCSERPLQVRSGSAIGILRSTSLPDTNSLGLSATPAGAAAAAAAAGSFPAFGFSSRMSMASSCAELPTLAEDEVLDGCDADSCVWGSSANFGDVDAEDDGDDDDDHNAEPKAEATSKTSAAAGGFSSPATGAAAAAPAGQPRATSLLAQPRRRPLQRASEDGDGGGRPGAGCGRAAPTRHSQPPAPWDGPRPAAAAYFRRGRFFVSSSVVAR